MTDEKGQCAHRQVLANPWPNEDGTKWDRWECASCGFLFVPSRAAVSAPAPPEAGAPSALDEAFLEWANRPTLATRDARAAQEAAFRAGALWMREIAAGIVEDAAYEPDEAIEVLIHDFSEAIRHIGGAL